jgi:rhodanese-related sulfurtransferase
MRQREWLWKLTLMRSRRRTVMTVCRSGHRSARAAALLACHGHEAVNLAGGIRTWARAGLPVVTRGGRPGQEV